MDKMTSENVLNRKRGRPSGKNRIPLSLAERRARNAQYERERRHETSEAFAQLAEAVGCDPSLNNSEILATVISHIGKATEKNTVNNIAELRRCNEELMRQIEAIGQRDWEDVESNEEDENIVEIERKRRKSKASKSSK